MFSVEVSTLNPAYRMNVNLDPVSDLFVVRGELIINNPRNYNHTNDLMEPVISTGLKTLKRK